MKNKKSLMMLISILLVLFLGLFAKESNASELTGYMGVQTYRESGYGYRIKDSMPPSTGINVWKIVKYPNYVSSSNPGTIDWSNSIYCVRAGVGFTANSKYVNYTKNYDMKQDKDTVLDIMSGILSSHGLTVEQINTYKGNYNKILWILDNLYVPAKSAEGQERAKTDRDRLLANAGIDSRYFEVITDDDIEVVQQLVLWYYTNFDDTDYHKADFQTIFLGQNDNFKALADYGDEGVMRQHLMQMLFTYFINHAEENTSYESTGLLPLTINKSAVSCTEENSAYKFGPYEITKNSSLPYTFTFNFNQSGYVLKDENGNTITDLDQAVKNLNVGETLKVYAVVSKTSGIQGNFEFSYTVSYTNTTATFITTDATTRNNEQPLVNVEKVPNTETDKVVTPIPKKEFDLALRKFITKINGNDVEISREPVVDTTPLKNGQSTANYKHTKQPLSVRVGDIVTYKIRVYNEGELDGYVSEITDYLPEWLDFIPEDEENISYGWLIDGDRKVKTTITAKDTEYSQMQEELYQSRGEKGTKLSLYDGGDTLDYIDVQIKCRVNDKAVKGNLITNIADISGMTDEKGETIEADRDSLVANAPVLSGEELQNYIGKDTNKVDLSDTNYYYEGQEDDDDFEKLIIEEFDLALRKFITGVNNTIVTNRVPVVSVDSNEKITYTHTKQPVEVANGDIVTYTIRVYNEGSISGYATEIKDDIPEGLEFLPQQQTNIDYGWKMLDKDQNETQDPSKAVAIVTDHLADKLLHAYDNASGISDTNPEYQDVRVAFKVIEPNSSNRIITNKAEINQDSDDDIDSIPGEWNEGEDDQDVENIKLKEFDLALRKFITGVNNTIVTNRVPVVSTDTNGKIVYTHTKEPVEVATGDIVTYTIRVYNEGEVAGYATEITDDIPEGLEFLPQQQTNMDYGWKMLDKDQNETQDPSKAVMIVTDYLADKLLHAYDSASGISDTNPEYQDLQVAFKVVKQASKTDNSLIINEAQISADSDDDIDSVPSRDDKYNYDGENEDDIDYEPIRVTYFDLALRKFITGVNTTSVDSRYPEVSYDKESDNITYTHTKEPVEVESKDIVTYTIRVYNEGTRAGYAEEIKDNIPEGLEFLPDSVINTTYGWKMYKVIEIDGEEEYVEVTDPKEATFITTDYLSQAKESGVGDNLIKAFNKDAALSTEEPYNPDYKEVKVAFKVTEPNTSDRIIINKAEINQDSDDDIDSIPGEWNKGEDDQDIEKIKVKYFDLALRKFITAVDNTQVNNRYPELSYDEETGNIIYTHTKEPLEVESSNVITYTIRVYNEGEVAGYAEEIKDNIPEGLEFLPDNTINTTYGWKMYKVVETDGEAEYVEVTDPKEATFITTDYLSQAKEAQEGDNLIKAFDKDAALSTEEPYNPDYKEVKVAFKVTEPNTSDRIIINRAEINKDSGDDIDSTPGEWNEDEDDQDIEKIKVKYFDLALKKWVTQAIISENGKTDIVETGHTGDENPEPIVKVEIQSKKINTVTVKFKYNIKITNEGEIAGYAYEIKDYIPAGLKFVAEDNPLWMDLGNGVISTTQLENTLLQPGESATVEVILTWINGQDNMGLKVNTAEISKDSHDDIDSTPDNKVPGEDDIDDAPVLLAVRTGQMQIYFLLTGIILMTMAGGIILIKKFVL